MGQVSRGTITFAEIPTGKEILRVHKMLNAQTEPKVTLWGAALHS